MSPLGIFTAILAFFLFSSMDTLVKIFSEWYSSVEISFLLRTSVFVITAFILLIRSIKRKSFDSFQMKHPLSHIIRGILLALFSVCFAYTFQNLPLTTAYSIIFMLPIVTAIIATIFLKEHIFPTIWIAIFMGFVGMLLVLRPGIAPWSWAYATAFTAILLEAPFFILARKFHQKDYIFTTIFYPQIVSSICLYLIFFVFGTHTIQAIDFSKYYGIIILTICSISAQTCITYSLTKNDANISTSMQYSQVIWGLLYGYLVFKNLPTHPLLILGTIIIILSGYTVSTGHLPFFRKKKPVVKNRV